MKCIALIPAAGIGTRFGADMPKQYTRILGKSVLYHTVSVLHASEQIDAIWLILAPEDPYFKEADFPFQKLKVARCGGASRAETVKNGLQVLKANQVSAEDKVLVHDAARCCLDLATLNRFIQEARKSRHGALLALPVADTLKRADNQQQVAETVDRKMLWQAQTPQMFPFALLERALTQGQADQITDESSAVELLGLQPALIEGTLSNFKLTYPADHILAEAMLRLRKKE